MEYTLMQASTDEISTKAAKILKDGGDYLFDVSKSRVRLQPVAFGSRCCTGQEKQYHFFVGEGACR